MTFIYLVLIFMCIFEITCVPLVLAEGTLNAVILSYGIGIIVTFLICAVYFLKFGKKKISKQSKFDKTKAADLGKKLLSFFPPSPVMVVCILLFLYQLYTLFAYQHNDADDAWYLGISSVSWKTNTLFAYSPYTGEPLNLSRAKDYRLSPLPILWALCGKVFHVHPVIFAHVVVPIFMLVLAYTVYWQLAKVLFVGQGVQNKREYFLLFMNVINIFGRFSERTTGVFLLARSWQGKTFFCSIAIPLMFVFFIRLIRKYEEGTEVTWKDSDLMSLLILNLASAMASFTSVIFGSLLIGMVAFTVLIVTRKWKLPIYMGLTLLPNIVLLALYVFVV